MNTKLMFSSATDQWATPQAFFDQLNDEFHFTLDPCADDQNHKCDRYFTKEQDELVQSWESERVFCNPPYGRGIGDWVRKAAFESVTHNNTLSCLFRHGQTPDGCGVSVRIGVSVTLISSFYQSGCG